MAVAIERNPNLLVANRLAHDLGAVAGRWLQADVYELTPRTVFGLPLDGIIAPTRWAFHRP